MSFYVAQRSLYDIRDHKSYTVRKLADGNCWMTDNLAYELVALSDAEGSYNDGSTFTFNTGPYYSGDTDNIMNYNTHTPASNGYYYYSWYAATGGRGKPADINTDVDGSICPSGWKLPYNYSYKANKSYGGLLAAYGGPTTNREGNASAQEIEVVSSMPFSIQMEGRYWYGTVDYVGVSTHLWQSTVGPRGVDGTSHAYPYVFYFYPSQKQIQPQNVPRAGYIGRQVRCVAI